MRSVGRLRLTRPLTLTALGALMALGSAHCGSDEPEAPTYAGSRAERLAARLEADTGVKWIVQGDRAADDVQFAIPIGAHRPQGTTPSQRVQRFVTKYGRDLGATDADRELAAPREELASDGLAHVRFPVRDETGEVPIFDQELVAGVSPTGELAFILSPFRARTAGVSTRPTLSSDEALLRSRAVIAERCGVDDAAIPIPSPRLGLDVGSGAPRLVWRVEFDALLGECDSPQVQLDAKDGAVISLRDRAAGYPVRGNWGSRAHAIGELADRDKELNITGSGERYLLQSDGLPANVTTVDASGNTIRATAPNGFDIVDSAGKVLDATGAAVDAHHGVVRAVEYFATVHGRRGYDGVGGAVKVHAHLPSAARRAYFSRGVGLVFGDGDFMAKKEACRRCDPRASPCACKAEDGSIKVSADHFPFAAGLDVVGHEMMHGVVAHTSNLVYAGESGAIDEAIADVLGSSFERWATGVDSRDRFFIGERVTVNGVGLRHLDAPEKRSMPIDPCPPKIDAKGKELRDAKGAVVLQEPNRANDFCGVHRNSGIGGLAWYLMSFGGVHSASRVRVRDGIGWDRAAQLWFDSGTALDSNATYEKLAAIQVGRAFLRWGYGSPQLKAVVCAWTAVDVISWSPLYLGVACEEETAAAPKAEACAAIGEGLYCSPTPNLAYECKRGQIAGSRVCRDSKQTCVAGADGRASVDARGDVVCR